jgi:hypothetical protein
VDDLVKSDFLHEPGCVDGWLAACLFACMFRGSMQQASHMSKQALAVFGFKLMQQSSSDMCSSRRSVHLP